MKFTLCGLLRDPRSLSNTCTWYRYKKPMESKDRQQTFGSFIYHLKVLLLTLYEQLQCTKDFKKRCLKNSNSFKIYECEINAETLR